MIRKRINSLDKYKKRIQKSYEKKNTACRFSNMEKYPHVMTYYNTAKYLKQQKYYKKQRIDKNMDCFTKIMIKRENKQ